MYFSAAPFNLQQIAKVIPGEIRNRSITTANVRIDDVGKVKCWEMGRRKAQQLALQTLTRVRKVMPGITVIAIGEEDQNGKASIHVVSPTHMTTVLAVEVQSIIRDLGLASEKSRELSILVANEVLSDISLRYRIDNGDRLLENSTPFSGSFVINEKLKTKMVNAYSRKVEEYVNSIVASKSPLVKRLTRILGKRMNEIAIGIIAGLIVEGCIRITMLLLSMGHSTSGRERIEEIGFPKFVVDRVKSRIQFTARKAAHSFQSQEWEAIVFLNTLTKLRMLELVDPIDRKYKGTGQSSLPMLLGATILRRGERALPSGVFHEALAVARKKNGEFDWRPDFKLHNLYDAIAEESEE